MKRAALLFLVPFLTQCSSLTKPGNGIPLSEAPNQAKQILDRSAQTHGAPWSNYRKVTVSYDGKWAPFVNRIQPDLVDSGFRKRSAEIYDTRAGTVRQEHQGEEGRKEVFRSRKGVDVAYSPKKKITKAQRDASALVADAYTAFLFGTSWLQEHATNISLIEAALIEGHKCHRIQGRLQPGYGFSEHDDFIVWVDTKNHLCRRIQFTLNGLESTQGSDVSVTFSNFVKTKDGSVWPSEFLEYVERPIHIKAHQWKLLELSADGQKLITNQ